MSDHDPVNKPFHYNAHPSGIECIEVVRHMCFNIGNAIKYLWRAGLKGDAIEDLKKARWYIDDEIALRENRKKPVSLKDFSEIKSAYVAAILQISEMPVSEAENLAEQYISCVFAGVPKL